MSETRKEIVKALAKARQSFKPVKKSAKNPQYHSEYATFDDIMASVEQALCENELILHFTEVQTTEPILWLKASLLHSSGEELSTCVYFPKLVGQGRVQNPVQDHAGTITYAKRSAINLLLGLGAEADDDGNYATGAEKAPQKPAQSQRSTSPSQPAVAAQPSKKALMQTAFDNIEITPNKALGSIILGIKPEEFNTKALSPAHWETLTLWAENIEEKENLALLATYVENHWATRTNANIESNQLYIKKQTGLDITAKASFTWLEWRDLLNLSIALTEADETEGE